MQKQLELRTGFWRDYATSVARNGFSPLVVKAGTKQPLYAKWPMACYLPSDLDFIEKH